MVDSLKRDDFSVIKAGSGCQNLGISRIEGIFVIGLVKNFQIWLRTFVTCSYAGAVDSAEDAKWMVRSIQNQIFSSKRRSFMQKRARLESLINEILRFFFLPTYGIVDWTV